MKTTTTIPPVPALAIDQRFRERGWRPTADHIIERRIAWALLHTLPHHCGGHPLVIDDGEERTPCADPAEAMEVLFNLDDAIVWCGRVGVVLVMGNGVDLISDYTNRPTVEAAVKAAQAAAGIED